MGPQETFLRKYAAAAVAAGRRFKLNPLIILSQAAHESAWGTSYSALNRHNLFGMLATKATSEFWHGQADKSRKAPFLTFRVYDSDTDSLSDFARLIATKPQYAGAYAVSYAPDLYAKAIAASPYISETNGDNRPQYAQAVASNARALRLLADRLKIPSPTNPNFSMYTAKFNDLKQLVDALAEDVAKADKGNKAAKVRIRQGLQQVKTTAQEFRVVLTEPLTSNDQL